VEEIIFFTFIPKVTLVLYIGYLTVVFCFLYLFTDFWFAFHFTQGHHPWPALLWHWAARGTRCGSASIFLAVGFV